MRLLATDIVSPPFVPSPDTAAVPQAPDLDWVSMVGGSLAAAGALFLLAGFLIKPLRNWSGSWLWFPVILVGFLVLMVPPLAEIPHQVRISQSWEATADEVFQRNRVADEAARVYGRDPDATAVYWSFGNQEIILDVNEDSEVRCDAMWEDDYPTTVACPLPHVAPDPAADAAVLPTLAEGVVVSPREDPALRAPSTWDRWALAWIGVAAVGLVWAVWSAVTLWWYLRVKRHERNETGGQIFRMGFATVGVIAGTLIAMWAGFTGVILLQDQDSDGNSARDGYERLLLRMRGVDPDTSYEMAWTREADETASAWIDMVKADAGVWLSSVPRGTQFGGGYDTPGVLLSGTEVACHVDDAPGLSNDWIVTCDKALER